MRDNKKQKAIINVPQYIWHHHRRRCCNVSNIVTRTGVEANRGAKEHLNPSLSAKVSFFGCKCALAVLGSLWELLWEKALTHTLDYFKVFKIDLFRDEWCLSHLLLPHLSFPSVVAAYKTLPLLPFTSAHLLVLLSVPH